MNNTWAICLILNLFEILFIAVFLYMMWQVIMSLFIKDEIAKNRFVDSNNAPVLIACTVAAFAAGIVYCYIMKIPFTRAVMTTGIFTISPFLIDKELDNYSKGRLNLVYIDIFMMFQLCFEAGLDLEHALEMSADYIYNPRTKKVFLKAAAKYTRNRNREETMKFLYSKIRTKQIGILKSIIIQFDRVGYKSVESLETITKIVQADKKAAMVKKRDSIQYYVMFATGLLLMGVFNLTFFPMIGGVSSNMFLIFR